MATTGTPRRPGTSGTNSPHRTGGNGTPTRPGQAQGGRRRKPRRRGFWHKVKLFFLAATFLALIVVIAAAGFLILQFRQQPQGITLPTTTLGRTLIYSADGVLLANLYLENREVVPIERIPKNLQNATIAFEDKRFYEHQGVDFKGVARSLFQNLKSGNLKAEGGSTITQQLARNMQVQGLTREKSIKRKLKEWMVANQIERSYTKQDILGMYLNYVNYGSGAFGVEAAAKTYFGKDVSKLDLAQCALLAGLPNRPSEYNPYKNKEESLGQRGRVLQEMLDQHYITPQQFSHASAEKIRLAGSRPPSPGSHIYAAPYFTDYVIEQLKEKYGEDTVMQGNLRVYTTLNMAMQKEAESALRAGITRAGGRGPTQGCLVALDPKNGEIKAMVGGVNYQKSQFNIAAYGRRQPGSTFKAIVYSAAIDSGLVTEQTRVYDAPVTYQSGGRPWTPKDDTSYSYGHVDLRTAMAQSINVVAAKVMYQEGPPLVIRYARLMGIDPDTPLDPVLSLALGSNGVTPLEMASVYGTLADGGNHAVPTSLMRLDDGLGNLKEDFPPVVETQVLQKSTVTQLNDMLRAVVEDGTGRAVGDVPEARGKTGTTQGHQDVWFIGYTPNLVCAVWAGHPTYTKLPDGTIKYAYGEPMAGNAWGATVCAPIWREFMLSAEPVFLKAKARERALHHARAVAHPAPPPAAKKPPKPTNGAGSPPPVNLTEQPPAGPSPDTLPADNGMVTVNVDNATGLLAPRGARHSHREHYPNGAEPTVLAPQYDHSSDGGSVVPVVSSTQTPVDARPAPPPPSAPVAAAPQRPQYVTRRINPEDGLLATQWDPEQEDRQFVRGSEPTRYSPLHRPPPGER